MWVLLFPWVGPVVTLLHGGVSRIVGKTPTQCDVKLLESWESIITYSLQSVYETLIQRKLIPKLVYSFFRFSFEACKNMREWRQAIYCSCMDRIFWSEFFYFNAVNADSSC